MINYDGWQIAVTKDEVERPVWQLICGDTEIHLTFGERLVRCQLTTENAVTSERIARRDLGEYLALVDERLALPVIERLVGCELPSARG